MNHENHHLTDKGNEQLFPERMKMDMCNMPNPISVLLSFFTLLKEKDY